MAYANFYFTAMNKVIVGVNVWAGFNFCIGGGSVCDSMLENNGFERICVVLKSLITVIFQHRITPRND